jgi:hypothetical protein
MRPGDSRRTVEVEGAEAMQTKKTQVLIKPASKRLTLKRETLRRLTPSELRFAAGGAISMTSQVYACWGR